MALLRGAQLHRQHLALKAHSVYLQQMLLQSALELGFVLFAPFQTPFPRTLTQYQLAIALRLLLV